MARLFDSSALVEQMLNHERSTSFYRSSAILDLTVYEAANAFWKLWRVRKHITFEDASEHLENLGRLRSVLNIFSVASLDLSAVHRLAKATGLTFYDSSVLAVAEQNRLELVTADANLRRAASGRTRVIAPQDLDDS